MTYNEGLQKEYNVKSSKDGQINHFGYYMLEAFAGMMGYNENPISVSVGGYDYKVSISQLWYHVGTCEYKCHASIECDELLYREDLGYFHSDDEQQLLNLVAGYATVKAVRYDSFVYTL